MSNENPDVPGASLKNPASAGQNQEKKVLTRLKILTPVQMLDAKRKGISIVSGYIEASVSLNCEALKGLDDAGYGILKTNINPTDYEVSSNIDYVGGILSGKTIGEIYSETEKTYKINREKYEQIKKKQDEEYVARQEKRKIEEETQRKEGIEELKKAGASAELLEKFGSLQEGYNPLDQYLIIAKREKEEKDKQEWIKEHGSPELKIRNEKGYDVQRRYITERLEQELPGYVASKFDRLPEYDLRNRSDPTDNALAEQLRLEKLGIDAEVKWAKWNPTEDQEENGEEGEEGEIVYIEDWHGYEVYKKFPVE